MSEFVDVEGVRLYLASPDRSPGEWIGQHEILKQLLACWLTVDKADLPLAPRLVGQPGIGKTTLGMAAARARKQELFIYHASQLVTAMIKGGVCILDEGNRMNEKSWASLAPLLDHRRYAESMVAGITIAAHPDFRCAVTMNEDESTYEVPDYI